MKVTLPLSIFIAFIFIVNEKAVGLATNISNFFFIVGFIHFVTGLAIIVINGGLFKSLSYYFYKKTLNNRKHLEFSNDPEPHKPMSIYEFTQKRYHKKIKYVHFIFLGIACLVLSQICSYLTT